MSPPECCIWCADPDYPLAPGKAYCTKCQAKGKECVRCKRPMPAKYYALNSHRCNACHKKYLKERKKRARSPSPSEDDEEDIEIKRISDSDSSPPEEEEEEATKLTPAKKKKQQDTDSSPPEEEEEEEEATKPTAAKKKKQQDTVKTNPKSSEQPSTSTQSAPEVAKPPTANATAPKPERQYQRRKKIPPIIQAVNDTLKNRTVFIPIIWPEDVNKV